MILWRNSLPSAAYSSNNCKETFCWCLCSNRKWWAHRAQTLQYSKTSTTPWTTWCLISISAAISLSQVLPLWWNIYPSFLLVEAVHGQPLQADWRWLCSCLWKGLPTLCHCYCTCRHLHMHNEFVHKHLFLLNYKFYHCTSPKCVIISHYITSKYDHIYHTLQYCLELFIFPPHS
jgi:hypothetical protein